MKRFTGLFVSAFLTGSLTLGASEIKLELKKGEAAFEILKINKPQGATLDFPGGSISAKGAKKTLLFLRSTRKIPVKTGGIAEISADLAGTGSAALQIYYFDKTGKSAGWMTSIIKKLDATAHRRTVKFRVSPEYADGKNPTAISFGLLLGKGSTLTASNCTLNYEENPPNVTLKGIQSAHGGNVVRNKGLARRAAELRKRGERCIMFLGDSITEGWRYPANGKPYPGGLDTWNQYLVPLGAENFGVVGETIENVLFRITEGKQLDCMPRAVVLLIGTNNLRLSDESAPSRPEEIAKGIEHLILTIQKKVPDVRILLLAVTPRGGPFPTAAINRFLPDIARKTGALYLDSVPALTATTKPGEKLDSAVFRDGLHLSPKGYAILAKEILPVLNKLPNPSNSDAKSESKFL